MYLTSRDLHPLIQRARQEAGLPPYKSFRQAQCILARHNCRRRHIDPHHTLYDAAHAIHLCTRPMAGREPLNTYTPPTTDTQIRHLLATTPRPKQPYTVSPKKLDQLNRLHANNRLTLHQKEARLRHLAHARQRAAQKRAAQQAQRAAARQKRRQQALAALQKIAAQRAVNRAAHRATLQQKDAALRAQNYIPLAEALTLFNTIRKQRNLPPYKSPNSLHSLLTRHKIPRRPYTPGRHYYLASACRLLAQNILPRGAAENKGNHPNSRPIASQTELESGEYLTIKEFAAASGIPQHNICSHELRYNFHSLAHPKTGYTLIHAPTAAAHFLKHYSAPFE